MHEIFYETSSKYMIGFIEAEEKRIRRTIAAQVFQAFHGAGLHVTVSHDQNNETERHPKSTAAFLSAVFTDADYAAREVYVFAYTPGENWKLESTKPKHWVKLYLENTSDLISDYTTSAEKLLTVANSTAERYE